MWAAKKSLKRSAGSVSFLDAKSVGADLSEGNSLPDADSVYAHLVERGCSSIDWVPSPPKRANVRDGGGKNDSLFLLMQYNPVYSVALKATNYKKMFRKARMRALRAYYNKVLITINLKQQQPKQ